MIKIGITGQKGFVGQHLYNNLKLFPEEFQVVEFKREFFEDESELENFVSQCDVIVHLAAMNRHNVDDVIYNTNITLVQKLINALEVTKSKTHVLFSSSSQEERDNSYGRSKKVGRELFVKWSKRTGNLFTGLVIANVFGPFGNSYYNSFIATFCHQLTHNEQATIQADASVNLIYVGDLVKRIIREIKEGKGDELLELPHTDQFKVSEVLNILQSYKRQYLDLGIIPALNTSFELNLFNTFRSYIDINLYNPVKFVQHLDARGSFVEIIRQNNGGQFSFSITLPGITRGNHYHTRKIERFAVIKGKALIQLRKIGTNEVFDFYLDGKEPAYVDMPIWYTHNITNIGEEELYTNFWINEFYDPDDPDTFFEAV